MVDALDIAEVPAVLVDKLAERQFDAALLQMVKDVSRAPCVQCMHACSACMHDHLACLHLHQDGPVCLKCFPYMFLHSMFASQVQMRDGLASESIWLPRACLQHAG